MDNKQKRSELKKTFEGMKKGTEKALSELDELKIKNKKSRYNNLMVMGVACALSVGLMKVMVGEEHPDNYHDGCIEHLSETATPVHDSGTIRIEFSEKAVETCKEQRFEAGKKLNKGYFMFVGALGLCLFSAGALGRVNLPKKSKSQPQAPTP